jgi:hypothetical protein
VRYDETVERGEIPHALRFTCRRTRRGYVHPARDFTSSATDPNLPPKGMRVRLRADFDISSYPHAIQVILTAMKKYGMILADNGSNWYVSGTVNRRQDMTHIGSKADPPSTVKRRESVGKTKFSVLGWVAIGRR